ncbi:MAG TPA: polysaccharide biosynthesis/export family protein [Beijerinckiaceae bacterium]|nr:polysaccharide biosynthesis/export family protein [Beijerinckiaceae bacterium]
MTRTLPRHAALLAVLPLGLAVSACESTLTLGSSEPAHTNSTAAKPIGPVAAAPQALPEAAGKAMPLNSALLPKEAKTTLPEDVVKPAQRLQGGDKVRIVVYGEDKLTGDYEIDQSGAIAMPLAGVVKAEGLTKDELEKAIARRLSQARILKNPIVTVSVASFRPFYVLGEVERPGGYAYQNGLNAMSAVALAGGYTYRASKSKVMIQRAGEKGFTQYPLSPEVQIFPGDLISVPERYF